MNETHSYDPETFHPSITHSVYVTLEGSRLRLAYPRANIPRWAGFEETPHEASFLRSRTYQLANCKVSTFVKYCHFWVAGISLRERQGDLLPELSSLCTRIVIQHGGERPEGLRLK